MNLMLYDVDNNTDVELVDGEVLSVSCESKRYFSQMLACVKGLSSKEMALWQDDKQLDFMKHALTLIDYYEVETYEKTLLNKFYKLLDKRHNGKEDLEQSVFSIQKSLSDLLCLFTDGYNVEFDFAIPNSASEYAKFLSLRPKAETTDLIQSICGLIEMTADLQLYPLLILVDPSAFFSSEELGEIAKTCAYSHQKALFLETGMDRKPIPYVKKLLIDADFYDIMIR